MPAAAIAVWKPKLVITVTTIPPPASRPCACRCNGGEREQLVAVDDRAVAVDREHAVAVAVEGEAGVVAALAHRLGQHADVRRAAAVVDVAPVGLGVQQRHARAEAAEDLRRDHEGRAVGAVEDDVESREVEVARSAPASAAR